MFVTAFSDLCKGVLSYKTNHYDVVISDLKMPLMSGFDVMNAIYELNSAALIIMIYEFWNGKTIKEAHNGGVYKIFHKPLEFKELFETLREISRRLYPGRKNSNC